MSNQQLYNQHRANGVPHEEAITALGVNAATARTLKSRHSKQGATPEAKPLKVAKKQASIFESAHIAPVGTTLTKQTPDGWISVTKESETGALAMDSEVLQKFVALGKFDLQAARNAAVSLLFIGVVIGHAGLVWYDCGQMWGMPGVIGGAVTFAVVLAAVLLASDASKNRTSSSALWFVALIDAAAFFVHVPTFEKYADIGPIETRAFASFLCGCSFVALYLFRDSKLD